MKYLGPPDTGVSTNLDFLCSARLLTCLSHEYEVKNDHLCAQHQQLPPWNHLQKLSFFINKLTKQRTKCFSVYVLAILYV